MSGYPKNAGGVLDAAAAAVDELVRARYLSRTLLAARMGLLGDEDWRTALIESVTAVDGLSDSQLEVRRRAATQVADLPNQAWEPGMKVGWRDSLEGWYTATKQCIDTTAKTRIELRRTAACSPGDVTAAAAMDHDLATALYRAGLTAAGLVSDWPQWLTDRCLDTWPRGARREAQLDLLQDPAYVRQLQQLPRYWA